MNRRCSTHKFYETLKLVTGNTYRLIDQYTAYRFFNFEETLKRVTRNTYCLNNLYTAYWFFNFEERSNNIATSAYAPKIWTKEFIAIFAFHVVLMGAMYSTLVTVGNYTIEKYDVNPSI